MSRKPPKEIIYFLGRVPDRFDDPEEYPLYKSTEVRYRYARFIVKTRKVHYFTVHVSK